MVRIVGDNMSEIEMANLFCSSHAFIMLSQGEGWGLPYSEAMAHGLPTIGTRWSGNLEFMNESNSFLVDVAKFEPARGFIRRMFPAGAIPLMAVPNEDHAAAIMREVVMNYPAAREKGLQAREDLTARFSPAVVRKIAMKCLRELVA
jgi:glycosyltransferase involved in cell wall biosynthesis